MEMPIHTDASRRHDFVLLFDVSDGNPNGDPDAGNLPRVDPETMQGLVTDVSLKRRVRNWIDANFGDDQGYRIYIQNKGFALNTLHAEGYEASGLTPRGSKQAREDVETVRDWMCQHFYDIRTFGAVMTTGVNAGQVRGPVQMTFARSVDPIIPLDVAITRVAITKPEDTKVVVTDDEGEDREGRGKVSEMGRKSLVPYGFYRGSGFVMPAFAKQTGFSNDDLARFWQALVQMWDLDRSSSRGMTACRGVFIFSHESPYGNASASRLFDRIVVERREGVTTPRSAADYEVMVGNDLPAGVTLTVLEG